MSIIPKIKIGLPKSRDKHNLSFDCSTTANIGAIQPTMCREMVPNETFKVKVNSFVRLAPLTVPTFGRMSLRHYHAFVPYKDIWEPFNNLLSAQPYTNASNKTFVPTKCPFFCLADLIPFIMQYSDISFAQSNELTQYIGVSMNKEDLFAHVQAALDDYQATFQAIMQYMTFGHTSSFIQDHGNNSYDGVERTSNAKSGSYRWMFRPYYDKPGGNVILGNNLIMDYRANEPNRPLRLNTSSQPDGRVYYEEGVTPISPEGADLITQVLIPAADSPTHEELVVSVLFKFRPELKRLRTILIGLGYGFSPYSTTEQNFFKLIAYYKAWFETFRPKRDLSWQNTNAYKLLMICNGRNAVNLGSMRTVEDLSNPGAIRVFFMRFLRDVVNECFYYLPMDYFGMAVQKPQEQQGTTDAYIETALSRNSTTDVVNSASFQTHGTDSSITAGPALVGTDPSQGSYSAVPNPMITKLGLRLLTFANKNTVVGRSIRNYLKVHFGISGDIEHDSSEVFNIGSQRVDIQIGDVMATSSSYKTENGSTVSTTPLGDYGGKGTGYKEGKQFDFTAKDFGCWITLTVIVPESGYYQGHLRENTHNDRFSWFTPEFDALGYQVLTRGEVMDSYNCDSHAKGAGAYQSWNPTSDFNRNGCWGFVPRYSEYKIGRNIINGDFSLAGRLPEMAAYTLDRRIPEGWIAPLGLVRHEDESGHLDHRANGSAVVKPDFVPSLVYDNFRKIDPNDHLGQYNRMFFVQDNLEDHFLIHNLFEVTAIAPFKSLSTSFDTIQQGEADMSITKA